MTSVSCATAVVMPLASATDAPAPLPLPGPGRPGGHDHAGAVVSDVSPEVTEFPERTREPTESTTFTPLVAVSPVLPLRVPVRWKNRAESSYVTRLSFPSTPIVWISYPARAVARLVVAPAALPAGAAVGAGWGLYPAGEPARGGADPVGGGAGEGLLSPAELWVELPEVTEESETSTAMDPLAVALPVLPCTTVSSPT